MWICLLGRINGTSDHRTHLLFAHAETVVPLLTRMGLYKDDFKLTASTSEVFCHVCVCVCVCVHVSSFTRLYWQEWGFIRTISSWQRVQVRFPAMCVCVCVCVCTCMTLKYTYISHTFMYVRVCACFFIHTPLLTRMGLYKDNFRKHEHKRVFNLMHKHKHTHICRRCTCEEKPPFSFQQGHTYGS
jgi:hypothetical protein